MRQAIAAPLALGAALGAVFAGPPPSAMGVALAAPAPSAAGQAPGEAPGGSPAPDGAARGVVVAKLAWGEEPVERAKIDEEAWSRVRPSDPIRTGDRLRTSPGGLARLDFPWMLVTLDPSSEIHIPARTVLSTVLARGRAEFSGEGRDIVKIEVGDGEIRGGGRLVLWREGSRTAATALVGAFRVKASGRTVEIRAGQGTVVSDGQPPSAASTLPEPPTDIVPGADPIYVPSGQMARLSWTPERGAHHVQILALRSDDVLLARDVGPPPAQIEIPWVGTYRWQVSARDSRGLESPPSTAGFVCVVER